jgi:hypothetical protein
MKIARFWERSEMEITSRDGNRFPISGWGWSETSREEALRRSRDSVQNISARLTSGAGFPDAYGYANRPRREEIVEEITNDDGELIAFITRNHYGSLVLNTARLMFIDVDVPVQPPGSGFIRFFKQLFGKPSPLPAEIVRAKIADAAAKFPTLTFRVYRTLAGFRIAVVSKRISPKSAEAAELFQAFGADPLYVTLCSNQESFRARLTPKHWRCGIEKPPTEFPFETAQARTRIDIWKDAYDRGCSGFAACHLVEQIGSESATSENARLIRLHDSASKADSQLQLA